MLEYAAVRFLLKHWLPILAALLILAGAFAVRVHLWNDRETRDALAAETRLRIEIGEKYDSLTRQLADANTAAKVAIAAKVEAEKAAAKRLAQARKDWEKLYGSKPENRAWADAPLPADVRNRLSRSGSP